MWICLCYRDLHDEDFTILASKIVAVFPTELPTVYFKPSISAKNSPTHRYVKPKGKLYNKYGNLKKTPKELWEGNDSLDAVPVPEEVEFDPAELDAIQPNLQWLQNNEEPWEQAHYHWRVTSAYRRKKIGEDYSKSVADIYEEWPILKSPQAFGLINVDYRLAGFGGADGSLENFGEFFSKIIEAKPLKYSNDLVEDLLERLDDVNLDKSKMKISKFIGV